MKSPTHIPPWVRIPVPAYVWLFVSGLIAGLDWQGIKPGTDIYSQNFNKNGSQ